MQKTKKLLAFLLAFVMLLTMAVLPASAVEFSDVPENYQYYDAIQSLVVRGIINGYEDGTFKPEATITRAEFCKMVIYAMNLSNLVEGAVTDTGFPDVATTHWGAGNIKVAHDMGIINGFDDGTFKPEENVTYEQAVKMVVCAASEKLGSLALSNGGYPAGYLKVAQSYGFLKNITDGSNSAPAKRGTIAKLIDNMLKVDLSEVGAGAGSGNGSGRGENSGVGSDGVAEVKGQVIAVYGASIDEDVTAAKDQVKILRSNGSLEAYSVKELGLKDKMSDYLGKLVTVYYTHDDGARTQELTNLSLQRNKNDETVVAVDEILPGYRNTEITYYDEDGDEQEVSIASGATIMFNGRLADADFADLLEDNINYTGSVRFLSSEGNGTADIVFFTIYENIYVTSVSSSTKTVYGEGGKSFVIDPDDKNKTVTISKDGKSVSFSSISKGQILSISESIDKKIVDVLIASTTPPTGRVTAMDPAEREVKIGNKTYKFASNVEFGDDIDVGSNLKLYLDAFGQVAKYEFQSTASNYTYGYLLDFKNFGTTLNANIQMQVMNLTSSTAIKTPNNYKLSEKVSINNKNYRLPDDFEEILEVFETAAALYETDEYTLAAGELYQPIKYVVSNNVVSTILVGKEFSESTDADIRVDASALDGDGIKCTTKHSVLGGVYKLNSSTKVLLVPTDRSDYGEYALKSGTNSGFETGSFYNVMLVDVNKSGTPAVVVVYVGESSLSNISEWSSIAPGIVIKKASVEDGNQITIQTSAGEAAYIDEGTNFYSKVNVGDIVRISADTDKMIEALEVVMDAKAVYAGDEFIKIPNRTEINVFAGDEGTTRRLREGDNRSADNATMSLLAGTAYELEENALYLALEYPTTELDKTELANNDKLRNLSLSNAKIYAVEFKSDGSVDEVKTSEVEAEQIAAYVNVGDVADKLFVQMQGANTVKMVVIFRQAQ